jgi:hypothetical protein
MFINLSTMAKNLDSFSSSVALFGAKGYFSWDVDQHHPFEGTPT